MTEAEILYYDKVIEGETGDVSLIHVTCHECHKKSLIPKRKHLKCSHCNSYHTSQLDLVINN